MKESSAGSRWYPHPELNGNQRFRKPLLYPFELWGRFIRFYDHGMDAPAQSADKEFENRR